MSEPTLTVVRLPVQSVKDVARGLRVLADDIERGKYGSAHNLAYVVDTGNGVIEVGMLGQAGEPGPVAHLLLSLGQRKLEGALLNAAARE